MKAILVRPGPHFSVADVHRGLVTGLAANGVEVRDFNLDDRLNFYTSAHVKANGEFHQAFDYATACRHAALGLFVGCYQYEPDVVIVTTGMFLPHDMYTTMAEHRRVHGRPHTVLWCTESPYEDDNQLKMAGLVDTVILNDPTNIDRFRAHNPRTFYIPQAYDPTIHRPDGPKRRETPFDFGFVGTGYQSRMDFFEKVNWTGIDAVLAGHWRDVDYTSPLRPLLADEPDQCIQNTDAVDLYRSCRVSANLYRKEAQHEALSAGWAMGPREVELAACGTFFLREPRGEGDDLLWMLPTFTEPAEFEDLVRFWSNEDRRQERIDIARKARAAVADRTFENTTAELLRLISG